MENLRVEQMVEQQMEGMIAELQREVARLSFQVNALSRIAQTMAGSLDLHTVARAGLEQVLEIAAMDAGEILLWDDARDVLEQAVHAGTDAEAFRERQRFERGYGVPGEVLASGRMVLLGAADMDRRLVRRGLIAAGFRTFLSLPLYAEHRIVGVLNAACRTERRMDAEMEMLLLGLGSQLGTAIDRAHAYERERALRRRLEAVNSAAIAIAAERSLPALLQRVTDLARELTGARYGALGVADEDGHIVEFITSGISAEKRARVGHPPDGHGIVGVVLRGTKPVRIANIGDHPQAHGYPPHHPVMTSLLGTPIIMHGRNLGNLYLADKIGAEGFTEDDERLLVELAAHAAIAVENARLYSQTSEALQQRVAELRRANAQLARLSSLVIDAQEQERRRLARELHDDTAQALASVLVRLRVLERIEDPHELRARLHEFRAVVAGALDDVRRMALDLRPNTLDDLGLVPALETYTRQFAERWSVRVELAAEGMEARLPSPIELAVYRIVQEALTNIAKHAQAGRVQVEVRHQPRMLRVRVHDNGRGFDVATALASRDRGLGLFGMQERAQLVGGRLHITSSPRQGTTVTVSIPLPPETHREEHGDEETQDSARR
jgi:signal transduction histidine kinase